MAKHKVGTRIVQDASDAGDIQISTTPVATYKAIVELQLERSALMIHDDDQPPDRVRAALARRPDWWREKIEQGGAYPGDREKNLERLALHKFKALLDFDARVEGDTAAEIRDALLQRFQRTRDILLRRESEPFVVRFMRFEAYAVVMDDGLPQWGFTTPKLGTGTRLPPGIDTHMHLERGKSDLDVFIQNVIRADIYQRLEDSGA